jgi:hypothetical protein
MSETSSSISGSEEYNIYRGNHSVSQSVADDAPSIDEESHYNLNIPLQRAPKTKRGRSKSMSQSKMCESCSN